VATQNPTHAQSRQGDGKRYLEGLKRKRDSNQTLIEEIIMSHQIHSYSELQQQIHEDLRNQHPEWVRPNGDCPTCDSYEQRLAELIGRFQSSERDLVAA
jgi:hypothetical protein